MATIKAKYILEIDFEEVQALAQLLGNMTDPEFEKAGVSSEQREILREIWNMLPEGQCECDDL